MKIRVHKGCGGKVIGGYGRTKTFECLKCGSYIRREHTSMGAAR